jgi:hypothetical protein
MPPYPTYEDGVLFEKERSAHRRTAQPVVKVGLLYE